VLVNGSEHSTHRYRKIYWDWDHFCKTKNLMRKKLHFTVIMMPHDTITAEVHNTVTPAEEGLKLHHRKNRIVELAGLSNIQVLHRTVS
jgi:hypothetical protein